MPDVVNAMPGLRPCVVITGSVSIFALLIERAGLVPAVIAAILVATVGSRTMRIGEALIFALCIAAAMAVLFVGLLGQPFTLVAGL